MTHINSKDKTNKYKLSYQVKDELYKNGFSFLWNWEDYQYFKTQVNDTFYKVNAIVNLFISENNNPKSDYNEYIF